MRAWLLVCAALVLAPCRATAAHAQADLERIKSHILAKLGLSSRPMPLGAPPRDVVQEILDRATDNNPPEDHRHEEHAMREIIAIAQTGFKKNNEMCRLHLLELRQIKNGSCSCSVGHSSDTKMRTTDGSAQLLRST